ncbi:hypothetical protein P171DRAFT_369329 [Karstenula rhodostoma CBS 690.94]|uniref:CENP-V/GFA domain-containing protein n=1 Tax=Karstenula rhodostoma CBS 690.94 TaxID=1392251 RepID=A0A9P4PBF9_9PLEO|nr:hypothetical protein P171DRAFT_369329 [Karstenula rhodostoma CBS 690.94]
MSNIAFKSEFTGDLKQRDISKFSEPMTGTCLCGSISATIHDKGLFGDKPRGHLCHCANCRKASGSFVSSNMAIEKEKVTYEDKNGTLKVYDDWATGSGKCVKRSLCGNCGSPIMSQSEIVPHMYILKMGMFPRIPKPECEGFAEYRHEWQGKHDGLEQYALVRGQKKLGE